MGKIEWESIKDKFEAIGYLAKPGVIGCIEATVPADKLDAFRTGFSEKYTEEFPYITKAGSKYGFQFRIYLQDTEGCPKFLLKQLDETYENRINDTFFIRELVEKYGFMITHQPQDTVGIKKIVYEICKDNKELTGCKVAFDKGFSVYENFISALEKKIENKTLPEPIVSNTLPKKETKRSMVRRGVEAKTAFSMEQLSKMGWIGEEYFYRMLLANNRKVLDALKISGEYTVEWFNQGFESDSDWKDKSVGKGCDITITDENRTIFIEVKSSKRKQPIFTMTSKEMQCMKKKVNDYYIVKIDYLEKLIKGNSPEMMIFENPYELLFKPEKMKEATFMIGE